MEFIYNDGGRSKYFSTTNVGDCVTRAICNATGKDYLEVYKRLQTLEKTMKVGKREKRCSVRDGTRKRVLKHYIEKELGWIHHSTCELGSHDRKVKLTEDDLPNGTLIVQISKHLTCVKDKVIYDTYNCSTKQYRDEYGDVQVNDERCVYGYWTAPSNEELQFGKEQEEHAQKLIEKQNECIAKTKEKIAAIKNKYKPTLSKLEKKIKELKHRLVIEKNRMNREIKKVKEEDAKEFIDEVLYNGN